MSIGSIGSSLLSPYFAANSRGLAKYSPSIAVATTPTQSLDSPAEVTGLTAEESHLALRIQTRSSLRTYDDGTVSERISSKLQFHYDLTTADGEHIELNVKAKLQQTTVQDADGNFVSKTRLKLQFSLLQEGVAEGLSPLQSDPSGAAPGVTAPSGVADGLQAFLDAVDEALQQFTAGSNNSADDLLHNTVDAFNSLLGALANLLFPPAQTPADPAPPIDSEPGAELPVIPAPVPEVDVPDPLPPIADTPVVEESGAVGDPTAPEVSEEPIVADEIAPEPTPPTIPENEAAPAEPTATSPTELATQVLRDVRIRFVQSLTQIIGTLTPPDQSDPSSLATSQYLQYQSSLSVRIRSASLVNATA